MTARFNKYKKYRMPSLIWISDKQPIIFWYKHIPCKITTHLPPPQAQATLANSQFLDMPRFFLPHLGINTQGSSCLHHPSFFSPPLPGQLLLTSDIASFRKSPLISGCSLWYSPDAPDGQLPWQQEDVLCILADLVPSSCLPPNRWLTKKSNEWMNEFPPNSHPVLSYH